MRRLLGAIAFFFVSAATHAADAPSSKDANAAILAATPGAGTVFKLLDDGRIQHLQSGVLCPAAYPNVSFFHLFVYKPDGGDVGCDYRRADNLGGAWSKLSIFMTRYAAPMTLDQAFAGYRSELLETYPAARSQGEAVQLDDKSTSPIDIRSEEFLIPLNGQQYTTQLYVVVSKGWVIEVRATFVGPPNVVDAAREGADSAVLETGDRVMGPKALFDALGTIDPPAD